MNNDDNDSIEGYDDINDNDDNNIIECCAHFATSLWTFLHTFSCWGTFVQTYWFKNQGDIQK